MFSEFCVEEINEDIRKSLHEEEENEQEPNFRVTYTDHIKCNSGEMSMEITNQCMKGSGMSKHIVYQIEGKDSIGTIIISRRYSEIYQFW